MCLIEKTKIVTWNVGFIDQDVKSVVSGKPYKISWMKHSYNDRFFADPFLLAEEAGILHILAEEYLFSEGKGRIVELRVDKANKELKENKILIDTQFHLSYPFIYNGRIYAEQNKSGKWINYDTDGNPVNTVGNIGLIDATIWNDGKAEWVFATKIVEDKGEAIRKTYRYKIEDGKLDEESEMLVIDSLTASRPGGNFFRIDDTWYRPAQTSTHKIYGESIAICKVIENSERVYKEERVIEVNSHTEKRFSEGLHTFNPYKGYIIVDGFEMQMHPIQKMKYKLSQR